MSNRQFALVAQIVDPVPGYWSSYSFDDICYAGNDAGNEIIMVAPAGSYCVLRSTDNGNNVWEQVVWPDYTSYGPIHPKLWKIAANGTGAVFLAAFTEPPSWTKPNTIFKSTDYGKTWDFGSGTALGINNEYFQALVAHGNYVWVSVGGTGGGKVHVSSNLGVSYNDITSTFGGYEVFDLCYVGGGLILACTADGKLWKSTNYGVGGSWSVVTTLSSTALKIRAISADIWLTIGIDYKIYRTTNGGASFDAGTNLYLTGTERVRPKCIVYDHIKGIVYCGTSRLEGYVPPPPEEGWIEIGPGRIYRSLDYGATWGLVDELQTQSSVYAGGTDVFGGPLFILDDNGTRKKIIKKYETLPLSITPTRVIASGGRLDSTRTLFSKVASGGIYQHPTGQTLFLTNYGWRYNLGGFSYNINCSLTDAAPFDRMYSPT